MLAAFTTTPTELKWERRWHPLRQEWVVIAAHRKAGRGQATPKIRPKPTAPRR